MRRICRPSASSAWKWCAARRARSSEAGAIGGVVSLSTLHGGPDRGQVLLEGGGMGFGRVAMSGAGSFRQLTWGGVFERAHSDGDTSVRDSIGGPVSNDDYTRTVGSFSMGWSDRVTRSVRVDARFTSDERGNPGPYRIGSGRQLRRTRHHFARHQSQRAASRASGRSAIRCRCGIACRPRISRRHPRSSVRLATLTIGRAGSAAAIRRTWSGNAPASRSAWSC